MEESRHTERRLAAILSADVHGYSRMMGEDDVATVRELKRCREIIGDRVRDHHGRIVDAPGDNVLAEFPSAVEAVQCAVEIQHELADRNQTLEPARRMEFRIGVNLGDVISDAGKIYGDGVNIAARLERLAQPGGICLSKEVHDQIRGKLDLECEDIGEQRVKNIARPVRVLRVRMGPSSTPPVKPGSRKPIALAAIGLTLAIFAAAGSYFYLGRKLIPVANPHLAPSVEPTKATIAVLPFANLSASKDDEYFSDGMTDEIIGDLSKISGLQVAGRTSSFALKGQNLDAHKAAHMLGVQNLLAGSVRRARNKIRIEVQLTDAQSGFNLWSETYDEDLADVFRIQSQVSERVAEKLQIRLLTKEQARLERRPTDNLEAYNFFLLGKYAADQVSDAAIDKAIYYFQQAIDKDPKFALAYAYLALAYVQAGDFTASNRDVIPKIKHAATRALEIDPDLPEGHAMLAMGFLQDWDFANAQREFRRALALDPSNPFPKSAYGWCLAVLGKYDQALDQYSQARQLDLLHPQILTDTGDVYMLSRKFPQALSYYEQAIDMAPDFWWGYQGRGLLRICQKNVSAAIPDFEKAVALSDFPVTEADLGSAYALAGRRDDAMKILNKLKEQSKHRYVTPLAFLEIYAGLGETDKAFQFMEQLYQERSSFLLWLNLPSWDTLRSDFRFQAIYKKVGLPP